MNIRSNSDKIFDAINALLLILISFLCLYPMLYIVFASLSDPVRLMANRGLLILPLGFTIEGYKLIFKDSVLIGSLFNTLFYITVGVALNMVLTIMGAYVLSKKTMLKKPVMLMVTFTMFFSGGLIPFFLMVRDLGMYNKWTALVIPYAINTWNMIIMRTGFDAFPKDLEEAARIDGANEFTIFYKFLIPLSKAVIAVIFLYYVVGAWNSWFPAMIFLRDRPKFPLQLILREILIKNDISTLQTSGGSVAQGTYGETSSYKELVKYATIVVSTLPVLCFYPFIQKYFVKGVMIGSLKG